MTIEVLLDLLMDLDLESMHLDLISHANYYEGANSNHFGLIINLDRLIQGRNYWRSNPYY